MDVLSDVLRTVRLRSTVLGRFELRRPWALRVPPRAHAMFHVVLDGTCWVPAPGPSTSLSGTTAHRGDVLLFPRDGTQLLHDAAGSTAPVIDSNAVDLEAAIRPKSDASARVLCGLFEFEDRSTDLLLNAMPHVVRAADLRGDAEAWLGQTLVLLDRESRTRGPGALAALAGHCDTLFVYILRNHLVEQARVHGNGWLRAVSDEQIGAALGLIHGDPSTDWSVPQLASRVGMSRSAFAARFSKLVGETPLQYVLTWRLKRAAASLRETDHTIAAIAADAGYQSEAAFNKAFKRALGVTPGAYRDGATAAAA